MPTEPTEIAAPAPRMPPPRLTVNGLSRPGLASVSITLAAGECVGLSGPSGAGKSLLLRALADLDPAAGEVQLDGASRADMTAPSWRRHVIYVAAESGWWSETVGDHMADAAAAAGALPALGLPTDALNWPIARLSTGERQRLALLRALVLAPRVLLLDEPTSGLDSETTTRVETLLRRHLDTGTAILLVSHNRQQLRRLARRCLRIEGGRLAADADADTGPLS